MTATKTATKPAKATEVPAAEPPIFSELAAGVVSEPIPAVMAAPDFGREEDEPASLVIVVPSRGRPSSVERTVAAWLETRAFDVGAIRWALNSSDPHVDEYLEAIAYERKKAGGTIPEDGLGAIVYGDMRMVPRLNQASLDILVDALEVRAIGFQGDDHVPASHGWAHEYLAELDELVDLYGSGMVHGDDGLRGPRLASEWCVSRSWVTALGRMVPALVGHLYCDDAVQDLAKAAGVYRYLGPDVRVTHVHPLAEGAGAVTDDTYRRGGLNPALKASDEKVYRKWSMRPDTVDKTGLARQARILRSLRPASS